MHRRVETRTQAMELLEREQAHVIIPTVTEVTHRGEREWNIFSRLLKDRIVFIGTEIDDFVANLTIAQFLFLESEDPDKEIQVYVNSPGGVVTSVTADAVVVTTNGYLTADNGSILTFKGNLTIQSTNSLAWDTMDALLGTNTYNIGTGAKFLFSGASVTQTQAFTTPGLLLTGGFSGSPNPTTNGVQDVTTVSSVSGFNDNFAVAQLWLTNTTLSLASSLPAGPVGALFVQDLYLFGGSKLVISSNMSVYFINSNSWDMANITLLGSAQIHHHHARLDQPQGLIDLFELVSRTRPIAVFLGHLHIGVVDVVVEPRLVDFLAFGLDFHE